MSTFEITAPNGSFNGRRYGVSFHDGTGTTDDPASARQLQDMGYQVSPDPTDVEADSGAGGLEAVDGIGPKRLESLKSLGVETPEDLAEAETGAVAEVLDLSPETVAGWQDQV